MKKLLGLIFHPWLLAALGVLALSVAIWIIGPMIAIDRWRPLESERARWIFIGGFVALVLLRQAWRGWKARRTNTHVVAQLTAVAPSPAANDPASAEVAVLQQRFNQALEQLRQARFTSGRKGPGAVWSDFSARIGKRYLYELPWYVIIGAPGSGKTTALLNSGLNFPLSSTMGEHSVRGIGGTRNCDWWFTDEAVLIDTAGRYTTQTSDAETDAKAWEGFLGLLKRSRPRQPVSGVLVTVSVSDLLMQSASERATHAQAVRRRVQELHQHLGIRFPIYLLVTKCDLLAGFTDYLGDIDKEARATPWGFTFKLDGEQRTDLSAFNSEYEALEKRLQDGVIDRLQPERDAQRRARIYAFPQQFAGLRDVLLEFSQKVFSPSQFEQHPLLRGVYFVSGTQEGTPIDRMLGRLSRSFGLSSETAAAVPGQGRSYFLTRLLREVVFAESGLSGTNLKWERKRGALALGAYALLALGVGATLFAWTTSYLNNRRYVAQVEDSLSAAERLIQSSDKPTSDPRPLLPRLQAAQALPRAAPDGSVPWSLGFGLYQGDKLTSAADRAYQRLLVDGLLPSLALRVEQQLRSGANPELQYEALKAYVMLHDPEHFNAQALKLYVTEDWKATLPRDTTSEQREALTKHLDMLLAQGPAVSPLAQDKVLLQQTQRRLAATSLPSRIYQRLKRQGVGSGIAEFNAIKAGGPATPLVFRRASGTPLTQGIPGVFTYDGYHKGFQNEVTSVSQQLAEEEVWVLGVAQIERPALVPGFAQSQVADQVRRIYLNDYARVWEEFIADLKLQTPTSLAEAVQTARTLSAPDNPLVPLLRAMSRETTLSLAPDLAGKAGSVVRDKLEKSRTELGKLFGTQPVEAATTPKEQIESIVDNRFTALRQIVTSPGGQGPAPVDATIALLNEVYTFLNTADTAVKAGNPPPPSEIPNKVKAEGARAPEPVRSLVATLSVVGNTLVYGITRSNLSQAINSQIGEFCRQATSGRYPFVRSSERDVTQEDFARLFAPNGLFDDFFQKNLQPFVNTSTRPWSFRQQAGASMGSPGALLTFQRAAMIRETFFRSGGAVPGLKLDFTPGEMDTSITQFILDVDGQIVKYAHGPQIPVSIQWPGPRGSAQVRVELSPSSAAGSSGMVTSGPWALFRMIDRLQVEAGAAPERFRATFNVNGRKASFDVTTSSVRSPFRLRELEEFTCPAGL
ncbi:IcmF-related protein [Polaromonas sp. CG9_12]|nr:IcmF-related protein [Polaromonas sp. CG9_12]